MAQIEPPIEGTWAPGLDGVCDAFRQNFIERGEVGASLCVIRHGEVVVDLWGGWWPVGTRHAYHTNTYGFLIGEIVRCVTGELPGERLRQIASDVDADLWFGVPPTDQHRCADVIWASPPVGSPSTARC